jgi:hypothetical protein
MSSKLQLRWGRLLSALLIAFIASGSAVAADPTSLPIEGTTDSTMIMFQAWTIPVYGLGLIVAILAWGLRDHRRRLKAQRAGLPVDLPAVRPAMDRPWFRRRLVDQAGGSPDIVRLASRGAPLLLLLPALILAIRPTESWPAALGTVVLVGAWYAAMRALAATPQSMQAETSGSALIVRYRAPRAASMVLGGSMISIAVLFLMMLLGGDPHQQVPLAANLGMMGVVLFFPLMVASIVLTETWITEEGVSRRHRWFGSHRFYRWAELTGARVVADEKTPPQLELLGFTSIARIRVAMSCDGVGDLAAAMLKHMEPSALDTSAGLRPVLEGLAQRAGRPQRANAEGEVIG